MPVHKKYGTCRCNPCSGKKICAWHREPLPAHYAQLRDPHQNESMYNTPPVFAIYVAMLTMEWIKENGGLTGMELRNETKAALFYDEIDRNPLFMDTRCRKTDL